MKAYVIALFNDQYSITCARRTVNTAREFNKDLHIQMVKATTPGETIDWEYTYPLQGEKKEDHGLHLVGYRSDNHRKIMACAISHLKLWDLCVEKNEPIIILEHDAVFTRKFKLSRISNHIEDGDICMINDPRGATRRGQMYHQNIIKWDYGMHVVDGVNMPDEKNPDGLAGNSAYVITPLAAKKAAEMQREIGLWPNDALLCRQFFPRKLKSYFPYITRVEQKRSTTTS